MWYTLPRAAVEIGEIVTWTFLHIAIAVVRKSWLTDLHGVHMFNDAAQQRTFSTSSNSNTKGHPAAETSTRQFYNITDYANTYHCIKVSSGCRFSDLA